MSKACTFIEGITIFQHVTRLHVHKYMCIQRTKAFLCIHLFWHFAHQIHNIHGARGLPDKSEADVYEFFHVTDKLGLPLLHLEGADGWSVLRFGPEQREGVFAVLIMRSSVPWVHQCWQRRHLGEKTSVWVWLWRSLSWHTHHCHTLMYNGWFVHHYLFGRGLTGQQK